MKVPLSFFLSFVFLFADVIVICAGEGSLRRNDGFRKHAEDHSALTTNDEGRKAFVAQAADQPADDVASAAHKQADETIEIARSLSPLQMMGADIALIKKHLMPGRKPDIHKKVAEFFYILLSIAWFLVFFSFIYQADRGEDLARWEHVKIEPRAEHPGISMMQPDIVLVFHKPDFDYPDKDKEVSAATLKTVLPGGGDNTFSRMKELLDKCAKGHLERMLGSSAEMPDKEQTDVSSQAAPHATTLHDVRVALLRDIYEHLPEHGFEVSVFSSLDNDELFVCIALLNETVVRHMLQSHGMKVQIQKQVVKEVGIDQNPEEWESSPPFILYNHALSANVLGEGKTDYDFFEVFGHGRPTILAGQQRIRCIYEYLNRYINLDCAVQNKMLRQWFPAHNAERIAQLQGSWARWGLLEDIACVQPVTLLNNYFGSRVAFIFAWNGMYCKMFLALVPIACLFLLTDSIAAAVGRTQMWNRGSVLGLSVIIAIWARVAANLWAREQDYLIMSWGVDDMSKDMTMRADFQGTLRPSVVDAKLEELYYPRWKYNLRMAAAFLVTFVFCSFVFMVMNLWIEAFDGHMHIAATICQAIMIQVFTQIWNWMAEALTIAENHKFHENYYNSYLKKMFLFQFVNQYSAFLYMAVKQQFAKNGCVNNDCIGMISGQLPKTLLVLAVMRVFMVVLNTMIVKISLWWEARQIVSAGGKAPTYSYVEEQAKYGTFRIREQIEVMTQLTLTLGYVLIFGAIAPIIVPLCFVVFVVQLRAGAVLLTTAANRAVPRTALGIGPWSTVISYLLSFGVIFSGYLLVQFGPLFQGCETVTKLSCLCMYAMSIFILWCIVDVVCPKESNGASLLRQRRDYVKRRVTQVSEDRVFEKISNAENKKAGGKEGESRGLWSLVGGGKTDSETSNLQQRTNGTPYETEIREGKWDAIPGALKED